MATINEPNVHDDLSRLVIVHSDQLPWRPTPHAGVSRKSFEMIRNGKTRRECGLYRCDAGTRLEKANFDGRLEILVIQGELTLDGGDYGAGVYIRTPDGAVVRPGSARGCVFFYRLRTDTDSEGFAVIDCNDRSLWQTWGGRGNQRIPMDDPAEPGIGCWLGYMFPEHQAPEHDHPGGEEVFILHGEVEDHTGTYGSGTWARYPGGFVHSPAAHKDGALMLVREGDVRNPGNHGNR